MTKPTRDKPLKDRPWLIRTYAGHSTAAKSNELYRTNLARGQTGLSVAFDLPTQTGYDSDHPLARGEVGKVGVPVSHLGDVRTLFDGIPLDRMNTSMTINATAAWLLALYVAVAERHKVSRKELQGTTQNDIVKEYLSRGQTGLSVAFDLPTQTGYDSDHPLAKGEVGKVGVPISHLGDMRTLFDGDRKSTRLNSSHRSLSRMPSSA